MQDDLNMAILGATFKIEQMQDDGKKMSGTGWLVNLGGERSFFKKQTNKNKIALVTAHHVLDIMKKSTISLHWRRLDENGVWHREPEEIKIRDANNNQLWYNHPEKDVAVILVNPPHGPRAAALPFNSLMTEKSLKDRDITLGDELLALGYPKGLSANDLGFPILRSGRVASYPIWPLKQFPTFLMDFSVFPGNSGGPVYISEGSGGSSKYRHSDGHFIAGMLTQQVNLDQINLEIGIVLHSNFIRDTLLEFLEGAHSTDMT